MKTYVKLRKGNVKAEAERRKILTTLEVLKQEHPNLNMVIALATDADVICWLPELKNVKFEYEENREFEASESYLDVDEYTIFLLNAILISEVLK